MPKKILIVDDDPAILDMVGTKLEEVGYEVWKASDGAKAIKIARKNPPHLIIMDLLMPIMGGAGAVIQLKADKRLKQVPIFFLTGAEVDAHGLKREEIGADVIFHKPFSFQELLDKIREALGGPE